MIIFLLISFRLSDLKIAFDDDDDDFDDQTVEEEDDEKENIKNNLEKQSPSVKRLTKVTDSMMNDK
jgi:hypothetical protein